jgi:hypothetical protein
MTVRVAIDTLANVLAEGLEETEGRAPTDLHMTDRTTVGPRLRDRVPSA